MKIFVDLDGTLTNFIKQVSKVMGKPVKEDLGNDPKVWSAIARAGTKFWSEMEWLPKSDKLWDELKKFDPTILSSPSRHKSSIEGKKEWLEKNLPGVPFIIEQEKEKYAAPDAILIDDREKNIKKWEEKGGIGILHKSVPETLIKFSDAVQNIEKNIKKAADKGYVKFYKDSSNPKNLFALMDQNVFTVHANGGYPLFDLSKLSQNTFKGNIEEGKYLEIPFSRVLDYPTEGEGTTFTPYTASSRINRKIISEDIKELAKKMDKISMPYYEIVDPSTSEKISEDFKLELLSKEDAKALVEDFDKGYTIEIPRNKVHKVNNSNAMFTGMFKVFMEKFRKNPVGNPNPKLRYDRYLKKIEPIK
jgi:5'(3')-deoxyribonucleotidase